MHCSECGCVLFFDNHDCCVDCAVRKATQPTIPPAVREAAVRLRGWYQEGAKPHPWDDMGAEHMTEKKASILLICQHFLGRGQV